MDNRSPCKQTLEQLCDILEFELGHTGGREACKQVMEHIRNCPTCCAEVDTMRKTIKIIKQIPEHEVPREISYRLLVELQIRPPSGGTVTSRPPRDAR